MKPKLSTENDVATKACAKNHGERKKNIILKAIKIIQERIV